MKPHLDRSLSGEHVSFAFWWTSPSRGRRHVDARYDPFFEADGSVSGITVNMRDTTDRKQTEEEHERSVVSLEAANLELELFSASHCSRSEEPAADRDQLQRAPRGRTRRLAR